MAFMELHCYSRALVHQVALNILLPQRHPWEPEYAEPRKTLYLLHGIGDDHTGWLRRTGLERYLDGKNIAVVMPGVNRSFYADMADGGPKYWEYVAHELPELMQQFFGLRPNRETTFAAGLSMGGYGALKLGFLQPERFKAVAALSAAPMSQAMEQAQAQMRQAENEELMQQIHRVFGSSILPQDDVFAMAHAAARAPQKPALYFACGADDNLLPLNKALHEQTQALGFDTQWHEHAGYGHTWDYWDVVLPGVLAFIEGI